MLNDRLIKTKNYVDTELRYNSAVCLATYAQHLKFDIAHFIN